MPRVRPSYLRAGVYSTLPAGATTRSSSLVAVLGSGAKVQLEPDPHLYTSCGGDCAAQRRAYGTKGRLQATRQRHQVAVRHGASTA